jgi:DNA polymerase III delta prime subunit
MEPLFHANTKQAIADFLASPSHAMLLVGPAGSGKGFTAQYLAAQLLSIPPEKVAENPYVQWLHDQDKGVSIESIRKAQTFMQLKVPGKAAVRRVLIVEQGETMSLEAQNAFLKLLEEPPADSVIIITTTGLDRLLPTIRSRTQALQILPPAEAQLQKYFAGAHTPGAITKAFYMSEGYVGLMQALLDKDTEHPLVQSINTAKSLLSSTLFERLAKVDELTKQKNNALLLQALERVCHAALSQAVATGNTTSKRWKDRLRAVTEAQKLASTNVQSKLLLTNLMLAL